jgi:hypothetical protein
LTVSPALDLSLSDNGTLILQSMPLIIGQFIVNITVYDMGNLTNGISIPIRIHSINETRSISMEHTSLILFLTFFIIIFLAAIFISLCFLIAFILRRNLQNKPIDNSSSGSTTSSNEQANSSQKTTIEVLDEATVNI